MDFVQRLHIPLLRKAKGKDMNRRADPTLHRKPVAVPHANLEKRVYKSTKHPDGSTRNLQSHPDKNYEVGHVASGAEATVLTNYAQDKSDGQCYTVVQKIGSGGNGTVYLCEDTRSHNALVAVKAVPVCKKTDILNEVFMMDRIGHHENVVGYSGMLPYPSEQLYRHIVFEYCALGDLYHYAHQTEGTPESLIWDIFKQVTNGLHYLHSLGVVHGDLKMENVLVCTPCHKNTYPTFKIADFGNAVFNPLPNIPRDHLATWEYASPESRHRYGREAGIWSLGVILHYLIHQRFPYRIARTIKEDHHEWFATRKYRVPFGTQGPDIYKKFRLYCDEREIVVCRDTTPRYGSKLLLHFMIRCLDLNWRTRISSPRLQHFIPAIQRFEEDC